MVTAERSGVIGMKSCSLSRKTVSAFCMALAAFVLAGAVNASADEPELGTLIQQRGILVTVDQAKVIRIEHEADTVIIGNPAIADAVLYDRKTLVITGRAFGSTNILILDANGELVIDEVLRVQPATDSIVTVQRQRQNFTDRCTPLCKPAVAPGDQNEFYEQSINQSDRRNEFASQAAGRK